MSIKIMTAVWAAQIGSHTHKLVLLALADNADDSGLCYPSVSELAKKSEASVRTVERALVTLESEQHLSREFRPGHSTLYRIHPRQIDTPVKLTPRQDDTYPRHCDGTAPVRLTGPEKKKTSSLEPSIEPSLNRQGARARKSASPTREEPPPSNLNVEAWHRWEQYRIAIRKPMKPVSIPAAQRKLAAYGADQAAVVEQSIANGWQGLFELKQSAQPAGRKSFAEQLAALDPDGEGARELGL